jgi:hypothetical protein
LSHWQELELWLGPSHRGSAFGSRGELHAAWLRHRDRIMAAWAKNGRRPQGWWEFEAPFPHPDYECERSTLYEAGLLGEEEKAELAAWWREQFERTFKPHFFVCDGPGRIFEGAVARRKHFAWADIPRRLIDEWTRERQRRSNPRRDEKSSRCGCATSN